MKKLVFVLFMFISLVADDFSGVQKDILAKAIRLSGFECSFVNSARISYFTGGIVAYCDNFSYVFDITKSASGWTVKERR